MPKSANQKLKLLYLQHILQQNSDEEHPLTVQQLIDALKTYDISAERKSIYDDVQMLQQFGDDIVVEKGRQNQYYLGERHFQLAELKLLVDAVQSAKFMTAKKSGELIKKISGLVSRYEAARLNRQVYVQGRVKTMNESIYYNVDILQTAIAENRQVSYQYYQWVIDPAQPRMLGRSPRKDGEPYVISPWAMVWDDENYYMIGYDDEAGIIKHYRVDKMAALEVTNRPRLGQQVFDKLDMAQYTKHAFGMFGGQKTYVKMRFANSLVGVVVDRFGKDVFIAKDGEDHFTTTVEVMVSPQFIAWVLGLGGDVKILEPQAVARQLQDTLHKVAQLYQEDK